MNAQPVEWLPDSTVVDHVTRSAISKVIADWCTCWFGGERIKLGPLVPDSASGAPFDHLGGVLRGPLSPSTIRALALLALDVTVPQKNLTKADCRLVDLFAQRLLADLDDRLAQDRHGGTAETVPAGGAIIKLGLVDQKGKVVCEPWVTKNWLITFRKGRLPRYVPPPLSQVDLSAALDREMIPFELDFGSASISSHELKNLGLGDVLLLDRTLDAPIGVRACSSAIAVGAAHFAHDGRKIRLDIKS